MDQSHIQSRLNEESVGGRMFAAREAKSDSDLNKIGLYSTGQIGFAVFFGGPAAITYFLWTNLRALGRGQAERQVLLWGSLVTAAVILAAPFLPVTGMLREITPGMIAVIGIGLAQNFKMSNRDILASEGYKRQPFWKVVVATALILAAFLAILTAYVLFLDWINPPTFHSVPIQPA